MSTYTHAEQAYTTKDEPERANLVKEFEWATTDLEKVVSELQQRLSPLLRPEYDGNKVAGEPMAEVSAARSQLHNLHEHTARLRWLLDRLEV